MAAKKEVKLGVGTAAFALPIAWLKPILVMVLGAIVTPAGDQIITDKGKEFIVNLLDKLTKKTL